MRHLKAGKRLGVTTSHRKAMMRNLVTSLLEKGEIKTTITRAREMRKYFDKMIGLGKKNTLHSRRQALAFVKSDEAVEKLFGEYGPLYKDRSGGYTRIYKLGTRLGDNAQLALIQMVGIDVSVKEVKTKDEPIKEVKEDLEKDLASEEQVAKEASGDSGSEPVDKVAEKPITEVEADQKQKVKADAEETKPSKGKSEGSADKAPDNKEVEKTDQK